MTGTTSGRIIRQMRTRLAVTVVVLLLGAGCAQPERTAEKGEKAPAAAGADAGTITATTSTVADLAVIEGALAQIDTELKGADEALQATEEEDVEQ